MVNENIKTIIENKKPVETVYELKNETQSVVGDQIPSFEEFMKGYEPSEEVEFISEAEWQDRVLHGPQFGPGNEQSKKGLAKWGGKAAIVTTASLLFPPAGVAIGGAAVFGISKFTEHNIVESEDAKEMWKWIGDIGGSSVLGGVLDWSALKLANKTVNELKSLYNALDKEKDRRELKVHIDHLEYRLNYLSDCKVCNA